MAHRSPEKHFLTINKLQQRSIWFYQYKGKNNKLQNKIRYFPFEKRNKPLSIKQWIPSIQGCLYKAWLIISSSNEDISKVAMFFIATINYSWKGVWSFTWKNLNPLHPWIDALHQVWLKLVKSFLRRSF